ncbi:MAG: peptidylprolyl isomerase [Solobacterium sp.]|nr:peptidylprolyl isomerase [Solobacterium sp.]MDY2732395.1 peptidylprolyl isomerase [Erysipelotrichaceae bacterium]MCI7731632.1 peptidylprolyl isomerase [Solobacterium sp.]MDD5983430.1 peptidylprolyl isomerase [Solobacterium sp.]MDD6121251.1 peptidylprolyl isomerase [Solobacterium sp.]
MVTITMDDGGVITLELYPNIAPETVNNFVSLVNKGFYDGLSFHRIIPGFMIQGGDPLGNGTGGPGYSIKGEFKSNGFRNDLRHERGVISMARAMDPNSAGSQFFIMHADAPHLDGSYAAFGKVIDGMGVVDSIASVRTNMFNDAPVTPVVIKSITVDTKGEEFKEPNKLAER